jgi:hypothetical protein
VAHSQKSDSEVKNHADLINAEVADVEREADEAASEATEAQATELLADQIAEAQDSAT